MLSIQGDAGAPPGPASSPLQKGSHRSGGLGREGVMGILGNSVFRHPKYSVLSTLVKYSGTSKYSVLSTFANCTGGRPPCKIPFPLWVWFTDWSLTPTSFGLYRGKEPRLSSNGPRFAPVSLRAGFCSMWPYGVTLSPSRHLSPAQPLTRLQIRSMTICQHGPLRPRVVFGIRVESGWGGGLPMGLTVEETQGRGRWTWLCTG